MRRTPFAYRVRRVVNPSQRSHSQERPKQLIRMKEMVAQPLSLCYYNNPETWTKRVPDLNTITRIPRRRQMLETAEKVPVAMYYSLETDRPWLWDPNWKPVPFGRRINPGSEKRGTFYGKRYFSGTRPKLPKDKHLAVLRYQLCRLKPKRSYFQLQEEEFQAEWRKMEKVFNWCYGSSRSGQRLQAPITYFEDRQLVVFKFMDRFGRGRLIKLSEPLPLILDLDEGILYPAPKELYAMDEQFLYAPFCSITTIIRKEEMVLSNSFIESNFGIFMGTATSKDAQLLFSYCMDNYMINFPFYLTDRVLLSVGDTYNVTVTLNPNCEHTINYIERLLMLQIKDRLYEHIENCTHSANIRMTDLIDIKPEHVFLCTDKNLLDYLHYYLNMPSKRLEIYAQRNTIVKENLQIIFPDPVTDLPRPYADLVNMVYLAMIDSQVYRIVIRAPADRDNEFYVVLIDYGYARTIHFRAIWCRLPNPVVPGYIGRMPPLCNRFLVHNWDDYRLERTINAFADFIKGKNLAIRVVQLERLGYPQYPENLEYLRAACPMDDATLVTFKVYSDSGEMIADTRDVQFFDRLRNHMLSLGLPNPLLIGN